MKIRIAFILVAIFLSACANNIIVNDASKIELAKKAINENCLANIDYEIVVVKNVSVDIKHKSAKARVSYSKRYRAGILMLVLGDNRTEELKSIRKCASQYMDTLLEELFKAETARKTE